MAESSLSSSSWKSWGREIVVIICIVIVTYYCYETGLSNGFTFDDHLAIDGNHDVTSTNYDAYLWFHDIWGKDLVEIDSHKSYRPLLILIFRFLWSFDSKAQAFRIFSVSFHAIATYFVYHLSKSLQDNIYESYLISLGAVVLFASHPIHVESVTAVVNLAEPTSALFILLSYLLFRRIYSQLLQISHGFLYITFWISVWTLWIVLAILLKETGIIALLVSLAYSLTATVYLLFHDYFINIKLKRQGYPLINRSNRVFYAGIVSSGICCGLIYCYFVFREIITSPDRLLILKSPQRLFMYFLMYNFTNNGSTSYLNASGLIRKAENPFTLLRGTERVLSYLYLYFRYFALLVYPQQQSPEYSYDCIPSVKDIQDPRNYQSLLLFLIVGIFIVVAIIQFFTRLNKSVVTTTERISQVLVTSEQTNDKKFDYVSSYHNEADDSDNNTTSRPPSRIEQEISEINEGIITLPSLPFPETMLWIIIPFIPLTGIIFTLGTLLAERLMYLCSIGYCLLLARVLYVVTSKLFVRKSNSVPMIYLASVISIVSYYTVRTREYNLVWKNDDSLFFHALEVCPRSAKINLQVGKIYINQQNYYKAMNMIHQAYGIDPDFCDIQYTHALILLGMANEDAAVANSQSSAANKPLQSIQQSNLMSDYENKLEQAVELCLKNLQCVFTNKQSYKLLQEVWSHQLATVENRLQVLQHYFQQQLMNPPHGKISQNPQYYYYETEIEKAIDEKIALFEHQAIQSYDHSLTILAIQKYLDIAVFAFEKKRYKKTFLLLKRTHEAMHRLLEEQQLSWEGGDSSAAPQGLAAASLSGLGGDGSSESTAMFISNIRFLQCRLAALSGTLRSTVLQGKNSNSDYAEVIERLPKRAFQNQTIFQFLQNATSSSNCLPFLLPSFNRLQAQLQKKKSSLSLVKTLLQEERGSRVQQQRQVFWDHILMSNSHFLQLAASRFFGIDFPRILSTDGTKSSLLSEEETVMEEILRQLTLGFTLEVISKERKHQDEWLQERIENNKSLESAMKPLDEWQKLTTIFEKVQEISHLTSPKFLQRHPMMVVQVMNTWNRLGQKYYQERQFVKAAKYYGLLLSMYHALECQNMELFFTAFVYLTHVPSNFTSTTATLRYGNHLLQLHVSTWKKSPHRLLFDSFYALLVNQKTNQATQQRYPRLELTKRPIFVNWVYYYADSLVGIEGFYENSEAVWVVTRLLEYYERSIKYLREYSELKKETPFIDSEVVHSLTEKFRKIYCQMTDIEKQDYELCAYG